MSDMGEVELRCDYWNFTCLNCKHENVFKCSIFHETGSEDPNRKRLTCGDPEIDKQLNSMPTIVFPEFVKCEKCGTGFGVKPMLHVRVKDNEQGEDDERRIC
jgi:hypothetical protein